MTMLTLAPMGRRLDLAEGTPLRDVLFGEGVEFPCGGVGRCKACRVRVIDGAMTALPEDLAAFSLDEIRDGWRLACRHRVEGDVTLALAQWQMAVLDDTEDFVFTPREGLGIAIDLGTTTIAAQLLDLKTGQVLAAKTALNAQARHGADLLTRAAYAMAGGASELTALIHGQIGAMVAALSCDAGQIVIAGNSAMHHFFGGLDITPLATHPFLPQRPQALRLSGTDLGWRTNAAVDVLACVGGMVGGDVLAGVMATGLSHKPGLVALVDLGTNGEVVVAQGGRLLCTSTAAGPAFEGARITHGMRAATGALDAVDAHGNCHVIGNGVARGISGSG